MEKFENHIQKMNPDKEREIFKKNPDIKQNAEHFIIETERGEKHYIPKRDYIDLKTKKMENAEKIPVEKVIEATKKYPDKPLSEALKLLEDQE